VGEDIPGKLVEDTTTLTKEQKDKILYKNALGFLGLPETFFSQSTPSTPVLGTQAEDTQVSYQAPVGADGVEGLSLEGLTV